MFNPDLSQLLAPAVSALGSPCLTGAVTDYSWAEGITLMTVFIMFFIELMVSRFDLLREKNRDLEVSDPSIALFKRSEKK